jgi:hypothetical protein
MSDYVVSRLRHEATVWGCLVCLCVLAACSRPAEPPRGALGLAFGDAPPGDLMRLAVPLPDGLAESLVFYAPAGRIDDFFGVALAEPVLAFYRDRFFSLAAVLAAPGDEPRLRRRLDEVFGPPYCRDGAGASACLWRADPVEATLEAAPGGPARFMLRHRPEAESVGAVMGQGQVPAGEPEPPQW